MAVRLWGIEKCVVLTSSWKSCASFSWNQLFPILSVREKGREEARLPEPMPGKGWSQLLSHGRHGTVRSCRRHTRALLLAAASPAQPGACHPSVFTEIKWSRSIRGYHYCLRHSISTINNLLCSLHAREEEEEMAKQIFVGGTGCSRRAAGRAEPSRPFRPASPGSALGPGSAGGRWCDGRPRCRSRCRSRAGQSRLGTAGTELPLGACRKSPV